MNINELLGLKDFTMAISGFPDPYITCCFVGDNRIFVNLFYNFDLTHHHFVWDTSKKQIVGQHVQYKMDCSKKNFPYKSFYNDDKNEIYSFYRQGQAFKINAKNSDPNDWTWSVEKMTDSDLGQMYLIYNRALIARSSSNILFFKQTWDEVNEKWKWVQYNCIPARGFIYYIKGNVRI